MGEFFFLTDVEKGWFLALGESFQHCHRVLIAEKRGVASVEVSQPLTTAHFMIDLQLLHLINREWTHPVLDRLMPVISDLKAWVPVIAVTVVAVLWWSEGRSWRKVVGIGLCLLVTDNLVGYPIKHLAGKQRPNESVAWVLKRSPAKHPVRLLAFLKEPIVKPTKVVPLGQRGYSFPSNHVLNTTGALTFIWLAWGGWTRWLFLIVPVLCWSRIYCGAHWPSDMPHSVLFAVITAWGMHHLLRKWMQGSQRTSPLLPEPESTERVGLPQQQGGQA